MAEAVEAAVAGASNDLGFVRLDQKRFARAPQKSIDYAVMEKTDRAAVVDGDFRWSDIGSWDALFDIAPRDKPGNVAAAARWSPSTRPTASCTPTDGSPPLLGVDDLVVVTTPDAVLVLPRDARRRRSRSWSPS